MRVPRGLTSEVRNDWHTLSTPAEQPVRFDPADLAMLPEPARRWLTHVISPGAEIKGSVELEMHGHIRLGAWRPFTAVQRLSAHGSVWAATARIFGLPIVGYDRYTRRSGEMRWRLLGTVPMMSASGEDVTRSAAARHAGELLITVPAAALGRDVGWRMLDPDRVTAILPGEMRTHEITLTMAPSGALSELIMPRWGKPNGEPFGEYAFGAVFDQEAAFGAFRIPRRITAGWHYGTDRWADGQFIRYTIDAARYS